MTPLYAISQALKKAGVLGIGQTPSAEDFNDAFNDLQNMLFQWQQQRWLVYSLIDVTYVGDGNESFTIGQGGDVNILRPDNIESAYFVQSNQGGLPVSYPLEILMAREDYNKIVLKSLVTWPQYLFFDSAFPLANVYINPIPPAGQFTIHLSIKAPLPDPANQSGEMGVPPEYNQAIILNLAVLLAISYGLPVPQDLRIEAVKSLNVIRGANTQIGRLDMPIGIADGGGGAGGGGRYNPYSDRVG